MKKVLQFFINLCKIYMNFNILQKWRKEVKKK
jgi:hypothetical protein